MTSVGASNQSGESSDRRRFCRDVGWNVASIGVLAVSGFTLNVVIGRFYGAAAFGLFSQVLAVYYVLSQLSVGGFAFSTLNLVAANADHGARVGRIIAAALLLTTSLGAIVSLLAFLSAHWLGKLFGSDAVGFGIRIVLPGLCCFALNKILMTSLNGLRRMRSYAVFNALRYLLILICLLVLTWARAAPEILPLSLSLGEIVLLPLLLWYLGHRTPLRLRGSAYWAARHFWYGGRSFFNGLLLDLNLKVDVMLLGVYRSDRLVGIYSFASMLAIEGLYQLVVVIQSNMNPLLSRIPPSLRLIELRAHARRAAWLLMPSLAMISLLVGMVYPTLVGLLTGNPELAGGRIYFWVLMGGIVLGSSHLPFLFALNQWGHPDRFRRFLLVVVTSNFLGNVLLIPSLGALGAALGTAVTYALTGPLLVWFSRRAEGEAPDFSPACPR